MAMKPHHKNQHIMSNLTNFHASQAIIKEKVGHHNLYNEYFVGDRVYLKGREDLILMITGWGYFSEDKLNLSVYFEDGEERLVDSIPPVHFSEVYTEKQWQRFLYLIEAIAEQFCEKTASALDGATSTLSVFNRLEVLERFLVSFELGGETHGY